MEILNLQDVFKGRLFAVPDYQRPYTWEDEHRRELFEDILQIPSGKEHFGGLLVLHRRADQPPVPDRDRQVHQSYHLVDGQQRLTTLVLLLDGIARQLVLAGRPVDADGIRRSYVRTTHPNGLPLLRLLPAADADTWWRESVLADEPGPGDSGTPGERRLKRARKQIEEWFATERPRHQDDTAWVDWLLAVYDRVTQQLRFAVHVVQDEIDVGVIFEVMNDRGKPLTELEKVKNNLLHHCRRLDAGDLPRRITVAWGRIYGILHDAGLGSDAEDDVLRCHWLISRNPNARDWKGFKTVKAAMKERAASQDAAAFIAELDRYVQKLRDTALVYAEATRPMRQSSFALWGDRAQAVRSASEKLDRMGKLATFRPLLVAARLAHPDDADGYLELVNACEKYAFRVYCLKERRSDAGQAHLYRVAYNVYRGKTSLAVARDEVFRALRWYCNDDEFKKLLEDEGNWYELWWSHLKYFFYEYEEHLAGTKGVRVQWSAIDKADISSAIEHILPQTLPPSQQDEYWRERFPDARERKELLHDLGNLVLSHRDANSAYGNKPFPAKRGDITWKPACYCNSSLFQENALAEFQNWTPVNLRKRRKKLVTWALERWAIPTGAADAQDQDEGEDDA